MEGRAYGISTSGRELPKNTPWRCFAKSAQDAEKRPKYFPLQLNFMAGRVILGWPFFLRRSQEDPF